MGILVRGPWRHTGDPSTRAGTGLGTSAGQSPAGQLSENHRIARSKRPTLISAPSSSALSFLPSSSARELTVESGTPSKEAYARATVRSCSMPDMRPISVSLPVLSTVKLPDAPFVSSGHSTGMNDKLLLANIERLMKVQGVTADAVSRKAKRPDAIRNLRRRVQGEKQGSWTLDTLADVAAALETSPWELLRPVGAIPQDEGSREFVLSIIREELGTADVAPRSVKRRR